MNRIFKVMSPDFIELADPTVIKVSIGSDEPDFKILQKEALREVYGVRGLTSSPQLSKRLYKDNIDMWKSWVELKSKMKTDNKESDFNINDYDLVVYSIPDTYIVFSLTRNSKMLSDGLDKFFSELDNYKVNYFMNPEGIIQVLININDSMLDNSPIIAVDFDIVNGLYRMYTGVIQDSKYILSDSMINPKLRDSFEKFILSTDLKYEVNMAKILSNSQMYSKQPSLLSIKEVINIIKSGNLSIVLDETGMVEALLGLGNEEDEEVIVDFINSFNIPYKSLVKCVPPIRTNLKYQDLDSDTMLGILTRAYSFQENNINAMVLSNFMRAHHSRGFDINAVNDEIR